MGGGRLFEGCVPENTIQDYLISKHDIIFTKYSLCDVLMKPPVSSIYK